MKNDNKAKSVLDISLNSLKNMSEDQLLLLKMMYIVKRLYGIKNLNTVIRLIKRNIDNGTFPKEAIELPRKVQGTDFVFVKNVFWIFDESTFMIITGQEGIRK